MAQWVKVQHFHCNSLGRCYGEGSISGLETPTCHRCGQKNVYFSLYFQIFSCERVFRFYPVYLNYGKRHLKVLNPFGIKKGTHILSNTSFRKLTRIESKLMGLRVSV